MYLPTKKQLKKEILNYLADDKQEQQELNQQNNNNANLSSQK